MNGVEGVCAPEGADGAEGRSGARGVRPDPGPGRDRSNRRADHDGHEDPDRVPGHRQQPGRGLSWAGVTSRLPARQRGQGLVEYTLILALVVIVTVAALGLLGRQMLDAFRNVANTMQAP